MALNQKKTNHNKAFLVSGIVLLISVLVIALWAKNLRLKSDLQKTTTPTYDYDLEKLESLAKKINPDAIVIKNRNNKDLSANPKLDLAKELVIGSLETDDPNKIFHKIYLLKVDKEGNIYVAEQGRMTIKKFDKDGNYLLSIGREGKGPGEFSAYIRFVIDQNDILWVCDYGNQRMSKFTSDGEYLSSFRLNLSAWPKSFARDDDGNFYFSYYDEIKGVVQGNNKVIHKFTANGNYITSFGEPLKLELSNHHALRTIARNSYPGFLYIKVDRIYFTQHNPYKIGVYTNQGELIKWILRENDFMLPPKYEILDNKTYRFYHLVVSSFLGIRQKYIINTIYFPGLYFGFPKTVFDVFSLDGELITTLEIAERFIGFDIDDKGNLYGVLHHPEEGEQIVKYLLRLQ